MVTQERLHELFEVDLRTGFFINRKDRCKVKAGTIAGWWAGNYWKIKIDCETYLTHRLLWFFVHGTWPEEIDHRDGDHTNNAFSNLRDATSSQNKCNKSSTVGVSGLRGVYPNHKGGQSWRSMIQIGKRQIWLGSFNTKEEAALVYKEAAKLHHGEFAFHERNST